MLFLKNFEKMNTFGGWSIFAIDTVRPRWAGGWGRCRSRTSAWVRRRCCSTPRAIRTRRRGRPCWHRRVTSPMTSSISTTRTAKSISIPLNRQFYCLIIIFFLFWIFWFMAGDSCGGEINKSILDKDRYSLFVIQSLFMRSIIFFCQSLLISFFMSRWWL